MPIPTDSISHAIEQRANISAELDQQAQEQQRQEQARQRRADAAAIEARQADDRFVAQQMSLIQDGETREHLMQRIRDMRAEKPPEYKPPPLTPAMLQRLEEEQAEGRRVVARNQADLDAARAWRRQAELEEAARQGSNVPVHVPNPTQQEQFPANKATLGKTK